MERSKRNIEMPQYNSRGDYKNLTQEYLSKIKDLSDDDRINKVRVLLVKLYDDLKGSIDEAEKSGSKTGAINDDAIEGILCIADTCIEEQNGKKKLEIVLTDILNDQDYKNLNEEEKSCRYKARVNALYSLCTKHRRMKDFEEFKQLTDRNDDVSKDELFKIMKAYYYIQETPEDFNPETALKFWNKNISPIYKRLPAFTQIYTETVVLQCETTQKEDKALLNESEELIRAAIEMRKYPKFYSTLGRIYSCKNEYDNGIKEVRIAIEAEDSSRKDYMSRISEYQSLISRFQRKKDEGELKKAADKIKAELDRSKKDYLAILGFFSSVMALIITSIDFVKADMSMIESLQLLMSFAGVIVFSFGSLNLLLVRGDESRTYKYSDWTLPALGVFLFVLSFLIRILYKQLVINNWI